jgi:quinol monooxygenase YgiN
VPGWSYLLVSALLLVAIPGQQAVRPSSSDTRFYAVSYVEAMASSNGKAIALLKQYRDASAKQDGFVSIELFEQLGRRGHFALFEVWRDQKAFDARDAAVQKQLRDALQPIRVSDYDQRPYKTISLDDRRGGRPQGSQVVVVSHVDVAPNPQVAVMLQDLAEASRKEAGNLRFDVVQHTRKRSICTSPLPMRGNIATRCSR